MLVISSRAAKIVPNSSLVLSPKTRACSSVDRRCATPSPPASAMLCHSVAIPVVRRPTAQPPSSFSGNSSISASASLQLGIASRHQSILGGVHEPDIASYRAHVGASGPYRGQYSSLYDAGSLTSSQQVSALSAKGTGATGLEVRGAYGLLRPHSSKYGSAELVSSSSHGYAPRADRLLLRRFLNMLP